MRNVTAILIDPFAQTVTEVEHDADNYRDIYRLLSAPEHPVDLFTTTYSSVLAEDDAIFVDGEGLLKGPTGFFTLPGTSTLAGRGLILGSDEEGETVGSATSIEAVRKAVTFIGTGLVRLA